MACTVKVIIINGREEKESVPGCANRRRALSLALPNVVLFHESSGLWKHGTSYRRGEANPTTGEKYSMGGWNETGVHISLCAQRGLTVKVTCAQKWDAGKEQRCWCLREVCSLTV